MNPVRSARHQSSPVHLTDISHYADCCTTPQTTFLIILCADYTHTPVPNQTLYIYLSLPPSTRPYKDPAAFLTNIAQIFCDGVNQPLRSELRREGPSSSLAQFLDYALLCVGSSLTVGVAEEERNIAVGTAAKSSQPDSGTRSQNSGRTRAHSCNCGRQQRPFTKWWRRQSSVTAAIPESCNVTVVFPVSSQVRAALPVSSQVTAVVPESSLVTAVVPESSKVTAVVPESSKFGAVVPESSKVRAVVLESSKFRVVVPESSKIRAVVPESRKVKVVVHESSKVTAYPHEASSHHTMEATYELSAPPVMALEAVTELHVRPVLAMEPMYELSAPPVMAMEAITELSVHPVLAMEATYKLSALPVTAMEAVTELSVRPVPAMEPTYELSAPSVMAKKPVPVSMEGFGSVRSTLEGSCSLCSALVALSLASSAGSALVPCSAGPTSVPRSSTWTWPSNPRLVSPPPHRSPGLFGVWSVWKPLLGGGLCHESCPVCPPPELMQALIKMYREPHKLVLQNIAEVMDGPNIRTGDVEAFKPFVLRVCSLVSTLEQLGSEGTVELDCGSHVPRLQNKLPHELRTSFKIYIHPLRVTIPTLLDFSIWLEYEFQVQDDGSRMICLPPELSSRRRQDRRDPRALRKPTSLLLGTEKPITGSEIQAPAPTCHRKHLLILHDVNERTVADETETDTRENSCLVKTTKDITNGDKSIEAYAVLDDGSERTILLHTAKFPIQGAFTAERLGLPEQTHPVASLQKMYKHLAELLLQQIDRVQPVLLIGSDCPHLVTPIEPVRLGPPGGPVAVRTRLGWTLQGPTHEIKRGVNTHQCINTAISPNADLFAHVEKLWQMDVILYGNEKVVTSYKRRR
ncbi:C-type lectin domain family 4 member M [Labeo rohita]|uniref:C-type lectin domain family 4 member M n=1 Tax=Labeo rohita TaxID=84645 RepID=A0ABQ8L0X7_LABRO|nr:C-type lectin domain family 4 member M [Labeo rohita]